MLEKYLNKKVKIYATSMYNTAMGTISRVSRVGVVTDVDDKFIELDNNSVIAINYIVSIDLRD